MPRETIYLRDAAGQELVKGVWKYARGYVPGEPNEGLVEQLEGSPARLVDYDDSTWAVCPNLAERNSHGFSFIWFRIKITIPSEVKGENVAGGRVWFETNVDNYGEVYVDGNIDRDKWVVTGNNTPKRILIEDPAVPGTQHTIAVLVANAPLGAPVGSIFMRYATLAFEPAPGSST